MAEEKRLDPREFVTRAIRRFRTEKSKGIHVVYSGLNSAWKAHYGTDPKEGITALVAKGHFTTHPCKGGAMVYFADEAPPAGKKALDTILGPEPTA